MFVSVIRTLFLEQEFIYKNLNTNEFVINIEGPTALPLSRLIETVVRFLISSVIPFLHSLNENDFSEMLETTMVLLGDKSKAY